MLERADRLDEQNKELAKNMEEVNKSSHGPAFETALLTVDCNNITIKANLPASKVSGYSLTDLVGMHVNDLLPAIIRDSHSRFMAKFTSGQNYNSMDGIERKFFFQNKEDNRASQLSRMISLITSKHVHVEDVGACVHDVDFKTEHALFRLRILQYLQRLEKDLEGAVLTRTWRFRSKLTSNEVPGRLPITNLVYILLQMEQVCVMLKKNSLFQSSLCCILW